jgi:crossover junction endodeoxyribonuclease RuvC
MRFIGIDPGVNGAVAALDEDRAEVLDIPTFWVTKGTKRRQVYDLPVFFALLEYVGHRGASTYIVEDVHAMPGQGVTSMFSMGYGVGAIHGMLTALGRPFELVTPQRWKKELLAGVATKDKKAAYVKASRLYPGVDLGSRNDHGRAEALLIAEYGRRTRT